MSVYQILADNTLIVDRGKRFFVLLNEPILALERAYSVVDSVLLNTAEEGAFVIFKFYGIRFCPLENFFGATRFSSIELTGFKSIDLSP